MPATEFFQHIVPVIDLAQPSLWIAVAAVCFNPTFWNTVAQNEYRHRTLTRLLGNRPYAGCYVLGATIFALGLVRDALYEAALAAQPSAPALAQPAVRAVAAALFAAGAVLVGTSMWALGVTGTYLGDYFGILMPAMVTGFPFSVCSDPMYVGSTLCFAATALWHAKPAGLALTVVVALVYTVALRFEGPFTSYIYEQAAKEKQAAKNENENEKAPKDMAEGSSSAVSL